MGVFTVTRQVALGLNLKQPWWLSGAAVDLDFLNSRYYDSSLATGQQPRAQLSSYLSCTRASTGYAKNSAGNLVSFGNNALRQTDLGLLVEDARTNICLYSQDFPSGVTAGSWNFGGGASTVTITSNVAVAPDGTTTADKVAQTAGGTIEYSVYQQVTHTAVPYTNSIYAKAAELNFAWLKLNTNNIAQGAVAVVNLLTGAITSTNNSGGIVGASYSTEMFANGWVKITVTATGVAGNGFLTFGPISTGTPTYVGGTPNETGTAGSGVYFWGAQIEQAGFASSYIPTTSASVTRAADDVTISGAASTIIQATAGSEVIEVAPQPGQSSTAILIERASPAAGPSYLRENLATGVDHWNNSADLAATIGGGLSFAANVVKAGFAWSAAGRSIVAGGGSVAVDNGAVGTSATSKLGDATTTGINSYVRRLSFWSTRLTDAALRSMTYPAGMTDAAAWVAQVVVNGGTVSGARQFLVDTLINGLKTDGVWSKLDALWLFAAENSQSALVDLVQGRVATATNSPTFATDRGYTGNGTNAFINSNFNQTLVFSPNFVQNSASFFGWSNTGSDAVPGFGYIPTTSSTVTYIYPDQSGTAFYGINDSLGGSFNFHQTGATGIGLTHVNRSGASACQAYFNGTQVQTSTNASVAPANLNFCALGGVGSYYSGQVCAFGFGGSLSSADAANLYSRLRTYMTAVGVP